MKHAALTFALVLGCGAQILRLQVLDRFQLERESRIESAARSDALRSPGVTILHLAAFEHRLAFADLTWLQIVQELGQERLSMDSWGRVRRWSDIATDLDPRYFTVYHSVAVNLSTHGRLVDLADEVLIRGWERLPDRFEFPMLLGYNAYWIRGDALLGSDYLTAASKLPRSPRFLPALAGRMRYHGGDEQGAIEMLEIFLTELDGDARAEAEERLLILKSQVILREYDEACRRARQDLGYVMSAAQLFEAGLVESAPRDLLGNPIEMDADCIARTELIFVREFEARERVGQIGRREYQGLEMRAREPVP